MAMGTETAIVVRIIVGRLVAELLKYSGPTEIDTLSILDSN
jgi:hypothetical protein